MRFLILFLSGILTAMTLVIPEISLIAWISVVPFIYIVCTSKKSYLNGLIWSLGYYGVLYYWFVYLYPLDFAGLDDFQSLIVIIVAWVGMAGMQSLEHAFAPLIFKILNKKFNYLTPVIFASAWVIIEWFQTLFWTGVPWGRLAVSQYRMLPALQSASLFGSLFVSFLIILVNGFFAMILLKILTREKTQIYAFIAVGIFCVNFIFGLVALNIHKDTGDPVRVALIQGNIASGDKWADDSLGYSVNKYITLTEQAYIEHRPSIVLWPETVIPTVILRSSSLNKIVDLAQSIDAIIIVGTYNEDENDNLYNSLITFFPDGTVGREAPYYKRHLVPFGEYLPMPDFFKTFIPALAELNVFDNDIAPGVETAVTDTIWGKIGYLICFDSIYETLTVDSVREGAELMALSTNDSWYKDSAAVYQHNGHSVLRAVENGRSVDSSMGFTPLEGLGMGTRSGDIDPAVISFIMEKEGVTAKDVEGVLNKKSGVLGLSGVSSDFRDLEAAKNSGNERAAVALEVFFYKVAKSIGEYAAALNGADAVVFTAGIGENSPLVRREVCKYLTFLGVEIDEGKNSVKGAELELTTPESKMKVLVVPTNEELVIARDTLEMVRGGK